MRPRWTTLLPAEHGSWAFLALPAALGLARRPSISGAFLILAVLCAFLLRVPLQRASGPWRHPSAAAWISILRPLGLGSALGAMGFGRNHPLVVLGIGLALGAAFAGALDWRSKRTAAWELGAATVLTLQAPALLLLGGASPRESLLLWALLAAFTLPPVLYLRHLLGRGTGSGRMWASLGAHGLALLSVAVVVRLRWAPFAFLAWAALLAARAAWGATRRRPIRRAARLGIAETLVACAHFAWLSTWRPM